MSKPSLNRNSTTTHSHVSISNKYAHRVLGALALIYALFAGLHTLQDFDLWWQMAAGRWMVQHHQILSTDVFSYTASGQPWIYPVLGQILFYLGYLAGGYTLLSWLGAIACAGTTAILIRKNGIVVSALAVLAVPLIAARTQPRAEMFSTVFFALFVAVLWSYYRDRRTRLWLLPVLMLVWVNTHLGFVAGLAACVVYVLMEAAGLLFADQRDMALGHLRSAWLWLTLTAVATLANPWGPFVFRAVFRQQQAQAFHNFWIVEWESVRLSGASVRQAFDLLDPQSGFWWLALICLVAVCAGLSRRRWAAAGLLAGTLYMGFTHVRLQAMFALIVVVVGGSIIGDLGNARTYHARLWRIAPLAVTAVLTILVGVRCWDLASNRYYMRSNQLSVFGTGVSWWYPEKAVRFIEREQTPANLFNGYAVGGYLSWRLFPAYQDYIDSRAVPFGEELFLKAYALSSEAPDSPEWRTEAETRGINTIIVPLARYQGMTLFPQLHAFCRSQAWAPVYIDEVSAVFVRQSNDTAALTKRLRIDCDKARFELPESQPESARSKADAFNAWANAGGVFYSLERYPEALAALDRAQSVFENSANVHLLRALVLEQLGQAASAETEFRTSLALSPDEQTWFDLGLFYMTQKRYADAAEIFRQTAQSSSRPHESWMMLGQADLQMHQPERALEALDKAEQSSPFQDQGESLGRGFNSLIATARAKAAYQMGNLQQAVEYQEQAVKLAPEDAKLWLGLADLYEAEGRSTAAAQARLRAQHP